MVPLVGIMFNNVISGMTSYLAYKYEMTQALSSWLVGHFSMVLRGRYEIVYLTVPLVILAFLFANHFNIVGMGRDFSENLGVPYHLILFLGLTISAMITASIVVVVGSISYIGLIVPNVISMIKGDRIRGTLTDTALFGAVFVLACDMIGRSVIAPYELPIELIVGIVGSILFIATNLMKMVRRLCDELGKTVVLVLHEINYAAFYSDYICAFADGKVEKFGKVEEVITKETLSKLYRVEFEIMEIEGKPLSIWY